MNQYLEEPLELSFIEDVKEEELFIEDEEEAIVEDYDGNLETYEDEDLNDYLARRNSHLNKSEKEMYFELPAISSEDEDTWWALTDGMYGECPTNPIAYDAALEAMGF